MPNNTMYLWLPIGSSLAWFMAVAYSAMFVPLAMWWMVLNFAGFILCMVGMRCRGIVLHQCVALSPFWPLVAVYALALVVVRITEIGNGN